MHAPTLLRAPSGPEAATTLFESPHPQETGGVFLPEVGPYMPVPGTLDEEKVKQIRGGELFIGAYKSARAMHRVGIYRPEGYDPKAGLPMIGVTTPLGVGVRGHIQGVAEGMMRRGFVVIAKGPPRYYGPQRALTLLEDANEEMGLMTEVERLEMFGSADELGQYGESQSAMKIYAKLAVMRQMGRRAVRPLAVAPCCLEQVDYRHPVRQVMRAGQMIASGIRYARSATREELLAKRGTVSYKDMHHHLAVLPVLMSGEAGTFFDYIDPEQDGTTMLFGRDPHSDPHKSKRTIKTALPNMEVVVNPKYGHVDGIMSVETAAQRDAMLVEIAYEKSFELADAA